MLERIKFRVVHATSEDPRCLGTELEKHGPGINGWRSGKGAEFPQELILQLECRSRLGHMQLLVHQYLIPESIELFIGDRLALDGCGGSGVIVDLDQVHFVHLGQVSMSTNQGTAYKSRELKSITVKCVGAFIKLLINKAYRNKYNRDKQVAIVAINVFGELLGDEYEMTRSCTQITFEETPVRDKHLFSPFDDLSFTMYVDNEVQDIIRKLDMKKQEAVLDERFDYASKLKSSIEQLRKTGELLTKYQLEKQIAASREDYEIAKEKKNQMDSLRESVYKSLRVKELMEPNGRIPQNDEPGRIMPGMAGPISMAGSISMAMSMTDSIWSIPPDSISAVSTPDSLTSGRFSELLTPDPEHEKKESGYYSNDEPKLPPVFQKKRKPSPLIAKPVIIPKNVQKLKEPQVHRVPKEQPPPNDKGPQQKEKDVPPSKEKEPQQAPKEKEPAQPSKDKEPTQPLKDKEPPLPVVPPRRTQPPTSAKSARSASAVRAAPKLEPGGIGKSVVKEEPTPASKPGPMAKEAPKEEPKPKPEPPKPSPKKESESVSTIGSTLAAPCSSCILRPSNLSERARRYAALPIQVFGDGLVDRFFSKSFQVKEEGLRCLYKALSDYKRGDKENPASKVLRAATLLLQRTIKESIFGVFHLTTETLIYLFDEFARKHKLAGSELGQALERLLPELLSKSGDAALGKNKVAVDCILKLQSCPHIRNLNVISTNLTKPFDTPVHPRLAQSKSEMVEELLKTYGISAEKNCGLTARDYVEFGASAFNQTSEPTRKVAERILTKMYQTHPKLVRQNLPLEEELSKKNIPYRQLFQQFDKIDKERKDGSLVLKEVKVNQTMTSSVYIPKV